MQILGIEVRSRARAAMIGAGIYFLLAAVPPWFIGFNEIYFLFLPLLPVLTITISIWLVLQNYYRFILTQKASVIPIAVAAVFLFLEHDEPELGRYLLFGGGIYAVLFCFIVQMLFKIRYLFVDYKHAFLIGTLVLLPSALSNVWITGMISLWIGCTLWQLMIGLITERAFMRIYPGR